MKQQIVKGTLGIARIEGRYELVSKTIAEKIQQRNTKRDVIDSDDQSINDQETANEYDPYSGYEIPDDLTW